MKDSKGNIISVGDRVRFATWGMFDVWVEEWKRNRKNGDPLYVTHVDFGRVDCLLHEEDGSMLIRPSGVIGVIHFCTKPSWTDRPEFIEVIKG